MGVPGEPDGNTTGLQEFLPPPSMDQFLVQDPRQSLLFPELGMVVTGVPFSRLEKARYWDQAELRFVAEVTGGEAEPVKLGDKVAHAHLPNKWMLCLKVEEANTGKIAAYACPCGTFLTKGKE